ncbi:MAG TPA: hypothetical protein ENN30_01170, partial [Candidatus Woesearchaeota archaeon]|nr:hypothetical protein [Candidatus Woesearchaeota archaeon]
MKRWIFAFAILFAAAFAFGCTEQETKGPPSGPGYMLEISSNRIIEGGILNIKLTLSNPYETDMDVSSAELIGFDTGRFKPDAVRYEGSDIGVLEPGQSFPVIWTIEAPGTLTTDTETFNPKAKICFDMEQSYFFDIALLPRTGVQTAGEMPVLTKGSSYGPVSINPGSGLSQIYTGTADKAAKGSIVFDNAGIGKITTIYSMSMNVPESIYLDNTISGSGLRYSQAEGCEDSKCINNVCKIESSACSRLEKEIEIQNGVTVTAGIGVKDIADGTLTEAISLRTSGDISYGYCYNIDFGTVT